MNILSVGNSFSQDAHHLLHAFSVAAGHPLHTVNLYIGGCSLRRHYDNLLSDAAAYDCEYDGGSPSGKISLSAAFSLRPWDVVTFQQSSGQSGRPQTYIPYLPALAAAARRACPGARLMLHETWSYETDSTHPDFPAYHRDQHEMYRRLSDSYEMASRLIDAPTIPVGRVIQTLRDTLPAFDYAATGRSLCRDGFHLSPLYGRYSAAVTWYAALTGEDVRPLSADVCPADGPRPDPVLLSAIRQTVFSVLHPGCSEK